MLFVDVIFLDEYSELLCAVGMIVIYNYIRAKLPDKMFEKFLRCGETSISVYPILAGVEIVLK